MTCNPATQLWHNRPQPPLQQQQHHTTSSIQYALIISMQHWQKTPNPRSYCQKIKDLFRLHNSWQVNFPMIWPSQITTNSPL
jgi:hypothetical protein